MDDNDVLVLRVLLAVEAVLDRRLEDVLHLRLALIVRGHLARDENLARLQRNLRRRPGKSLSK